MIAESKNQGKLTVEYYGVTHTIGFDQDNTTYDFIEDAVAPLMIAMGYFPTNVYKDLGLTETLEVMKEALEDGR